MNEPHESKPIASMSTCGSYFDADEDTAKIEESPKITTILASELDGVSPETDASSVLNRGTVRGFVGSSDVLGNLYSSPICESIIPERARSTSELYGPPSALRRDVQSSLHPPGKYKVGLECLPEQLEGLRRRKGGRFTLMLVGQSGLGKTTFINTLFGTNILPARDVSKEQPNTEFKNTTSIVDHKAYLVEDGFGLDFTVVDTPGFGDHADNTFGWVPVTNYIDEQLRRYLFQEEQPDRSEKVDNRIHCALYFLQPSNKGLSTMDVESMKEISKRVNLIPVIAKADALCPQDLAKFKDDIKTIIKVQNIKICDLIDDPAVKENILKDIPYAIISSEEKFTNRDGKIVRGRNYGWGIAEVDNPQHCDFGKLRDVLLCTNLVDLILSTEHYYESCRTRLIDTRIHFAKENIRTLEPEWLRTLNFDDPSQNGLQNNHLLAIFGKSFIDEFAIEWSPYYIHKQWEAKKKFTDIISFEEQKFRDWKRALFNKQSDFNSEIESIHSSVKQLQQEIKVLENKRRRPSKD